MKSSSHPLLLVVIPALNEASTIARVIEAIPEHIEGFAERRVLVVDDGSTDKTVQEATRMGARVISHGENKGLGIAFQTAIHSALEQGVDCMVHIDADGQFNAQDIPKLTVAIAAGKADIVTCTRFAKRSSYPDMPGIKIWGNHVVRSILNWSLGQHFTDVSCGFRAYSREALLRLTLFGRFTYTHEVIFDAVQKNLRIKEVPLVVRGKREIGESRIARSVFTFGVQWLAIFFRSLRDSSPLQLFGILGSLITGAGVLSGLFVVGHWFQTGQTFPYRSVIILSAVLILLGAFFFTIALLADMIRRERVLLEEQLYLARKSEYNRKHD